MDTNFFILGNLENFLLYELQPARLPETLALKPASEWIGLFEQECRNAIRSLKDCRYRLSAGDFLRHSQLTYADTLDLLGCIRTYERSLAEETPDLERLAFYPMLVAALRKVLVYIEGQSSFCRDLTQFVPAEQLEAQQAELHQQNLLLRARYKSRDIDLTLQEILNKYLEGFIARSACSYQELQYTKKLMQGMAQSLAQGTSADYTMQLISRLICLNFNKADFYEYVKASISRRIEDEQRPERRSSALRFYSKEIQTLLCKPHIALKPESESIQTSLLRFLAAELEFSNQTPPAGPDGLAMDGALVQANPKEKLRILTNVHLLGMGMQLLMQTRMLANDAGSVKDCLRLVCDNFRTIGSERISMESLSRRLYDKDPRVAAQLKEKLLLMIDVLDRDYLK